MTIGRCEPVQTQLLIRIPLNGSVRQVPLKKCLLKLLRRNRTEFVAPDEKTEFRSVDFKAAFLTKCRSFEEKIGKVNKKKDNQFIVFAKIFRYNKRINFVSTGGARFAQEQLAEGNAAFVVAHTGGVFHGFTARSSPVGSALAGQQPWMGRVGLRGGHCFGH